MKKISPLLLVLLVFCLILTACTGGTGDSGNADDVSVAASCGVRVTADGNIFLWE